MKNAKSNKVIVGEIRQAIAGADSIGISAHVRPDGDAVGSVLGLGLALLASGKTVQMALSGGVSNSFRYLIGSNLIHKSFDGRCDLYISLDCGDLKRTGSILPGNDFDINIDHHITNERFACINLVEPGFVATSAILTDLIPKLGLKIDKDVASALLSGILSDSIGYRTSNTNVQALKLSTLLMQAGADLYYLYNKALVCRPYEAAKYWGYALSRMQKQDGMVWTSLTLEDRKNSGYKLEDDADLTNLLSAIEESRISVLFVEHSKKITKISWRSVPGVDVSVLAAEFGGGGHPAAAGAELTGSLQEIEETVLKRTSAYLHSLQKQTPRGELMNKNGVGK